MPLFETLFAGGTESVVAGVVPSVLRQSEALADHIASSTSDVGYAAWQRSVIMNVVDGGGLAGLLLVLSSVIVCCLAFIAAHKIIGQFKHDDGTPYSGGALFYLSVVVPIAALYFRLSAPLSFTGCTFDFHRAVMPN